MEGRSADRYEALLRHLQAGHELPVPRRGRRAFGLDIHPSAGRLALVALLVAVVWIAAIFVTDWWRQGQVDTWAGPNGPDPAVQSGLRLAGCPDVVFQEDIYFPSWVRFEGRVFRWGDSMRPIDKANLEASYPDTGYRNGDLRLYRVANSPEGQAGNQLLMRQGDAPAGALYVVADCG